MSTPGTQPRNHAITQAAHLLSNGTFSVLLTPRGGGFSALDGYALTRWSPDPSCELQGCFCFLRDLGSARFWSLSEAPRPAAAAQGNTRAQSDFVEFRCRAEEIEATVRVRVAETCNAEIRTISICNDGGRHRLLELTTYAELALNTLAADAAHPAFSKLFVQTAVDRLHGALFAWRRQRSPEDRALWVGQVLLGAENLSYETDRARFLGRTRGVADPLALQTAGQLSCTVGTVLDPVFAQCTACVVAPGETRRFDLITAAGATRAEAEAALQVAHEAGAAAVRTEQALSALGLPPAWSSSIEFDDADYGWANDAEPPHAALPQPRSDYGAFANDGSEYVTNIAPDLAPTPQPWINVIANEEFGCLFSERGAGYTWSQNSRENRITPWSNDAVSDPHGEALFVAADDEFWSVLPGPAPAPVPYEVRHGFGYSRVRHMHRDLEFDALVSVPRHDNVRFLRLAITNRASIARELTLWSYAQLVLGGTPADTRASVQTSYDADAGIIFAENPSREEFGQRVAFATAVVPGATTRSATGDRTAFLGTAGIARPHAVANAQALEPHFGSGYDPCAAQRFTIVVKAGAVLQCAFLLGEADNEAGARELVMKYATCEAIDAAVAEATSYWQHLLSVVHISTPEPALDLVANGWLTYQDLACRMWARSAFQQSGGAFGFRDQLQDSSGLLYYDANITRQQILLHAAHQFEQGDVLHWWHPPTSKGIRTRFADDLLWLPYITLFYVESTGDRALLEESARYITARELQAGEDEIFVWPNDSGSSGSIYDHCCRAIDRSLTRGAHGLPLMGVGDWNDGMNRVGRAGRGESVWLGFFLFDILQRFTPLCEARHDRERAQRYRAFQQPLLDALNDAGWDGEWYRRAFYDDGAPLGSRASDECRIDALAQAWAVLTCVAPPDRARSAMTALQQQLIDEQAGLIRLLTPPFDRTTHDPGYIKGYVPGVRENGGQYTHAALWVVRALAELGQQERAAPILAMLSPVSHTSNAAAVLKYQGEPYVVAADVYGTPPHVGRAGWTWYTGSAGWMLRTILESILGFTLLDGRYVRLQPCIPHAWPAFGLRYRFADGTIYHIKVERTDGETQVSAGGIDARVQGGSVIVPIVQTGDTHEIHVRLGDDVTPVYESIAAPLLRTTSE